MDEAMQDPPAEPVHVALQKYLAEPHLNRPNHRPLTPNDRKWAETQAFLMDLMKFLEGFPRVGLWYSDTAITAKTALEIFLKAFTALESVYRGSEREWPVKLLAFIGTMEEWIQRDPPAEEGPSPTVLRDSALVVIGTMLTSLRRDFSLVEGTTSQVWQVSKEFLAECIDAVDDIVAASTSTPFAAYNVTLFRSPRISSSDSASEGDSDTIPTFLFTSSWQTTPLLIDLLHVTTTPQNDLIICSNHFFQDLQLRQKQAINSVVQYCCTSPAARSDAQKIQYIRRLIEVISPLSANSAFSATVQTHLTHLLNWRLTDGPKEEWRPVDVALSSAFRKSGPPEASSVQLFMVLELVREEGWPTVVDPLRSVCYSYMAWVIPAATIEQVHSLREALLEDENEGAGEILRLVDRRLDALDAPLPVDTGNAATKRKRLEEIDIRSFIEQDVCRYLHRSKLDIPTDVSREQWVRGVVKVIRENCTLGIDGSDDSAKVERCGFLARLSCQLGHPEDETCPGESFPHRQSSRLVATAVHLSEILVGEIASKPSTGIWKAMLGMLAKVLTHCATTKTELPGLKSLIRSGLRHGDRNVRLAAGKTVKAMSSSYHATEVGSAAIPLLNDVISRGNVRVQETGLIALGLIGRSLIPSTQSAVIVALVAQFGHSTSLIQSLAYSQLLGLARFHNKAPFPFISPSLEHVSRYVVARICTSPTHLTETCRFLTCSVTDFLSISLPFVLPSLVATSSKDALETVAKHLDKTVPAMVLPLAAKILAHVLMLRAQNQYEEALHFLGSLLVNGSLRIDMLVNSHRMEILSELVIAMANPKTSGLAMSALQRLQTQSSTNPAASLGEFLQPHTLGILAHLNTAIVSARGKSSGPSKVDVIRSLGVLVDNVGPSIHNIAPQIMALLQGIIGVPELTEPTLETWFIFCKTLSFSDFGPHAGPTAAAIVNGWPNFPPAARDVAQKMINYVVLDSNNDIGPFLDDMVSLDGIPELHDANARLQELLKARSPESKLRNLLDRSMTENSAMSSQSLAELKVMLTTEPDLLRQMSSCAIFHPLIGEIIRALFTCACRDGEEFDGTRLLAFECIGILGALDPDRFDVIPENPAFVVLLNFAREDEAVEFALHLIRDVLAGAYRGASDIGWQNNLAYALQELLKFCGFTADLVQRSHQTLPATIVDRWRTLPKHVIETVAALLDGRLTLVEKAIEPIALPVYPTVPTYREWIQKWSRQLVGNVRNPQAAAIFNVFRNVVRHQDVSVARQLLPHLFLHGIISGTDDDRGALRSEVIAVLEDQISPTSSSPADKKLLSAQTIFSLMDHVSRWIQVARQEIHKRKKSRSSTLPLLMEHLTLVDSLMSSIDHDLMAKAAFETKAYARALMNFEQQIILKQERNTPDDQLQPYYERLHEIYAHLDEPDGMQGVSSLVLSPSLEHQIREHESTGRWTAAQSCWEIKLQNSPNDLEFHLGLIRCLRNLGHYDTLETHIRGILSRNPHWSETLSGFRAEGSWIVGDWEGVQETVRCSSSTQAEISIAALLLALREDKDEATISEAFSLARRRLGAPIVAAGRQSYRRSYEAVVQLHLVRELEMAHETSAVVRRRLNAGKDRKAQIALTEFTTDLAARLDTTLPTFRAREPILSMHRIALGTMLPGYAHARREISKAWLNTSKIARKAGHSQTAYSAILQARVIGDPFSFVESCKLVKADGDAHRALQELENAIARMPSLDSSYETENTKSMAKALLLRARWRNDTDRFDSKSIVQSFKESFNTQPWESPFFHLGRYYDSIRSQAKDRNQVALQTISVCKYFAEALVRGSKYIYQTMPRLLTLWLDMGEDPDLVKLERSGSQTGEDALIHFRSYYMKILQTIEWCIGKIPRYQWYTAFPQIVSRIEHPSKITFITLSKIVTGVLSEYPGQALWLFTGVVQSRRPERQRRGLEILNKVKAAPSDIPGFSVSSFVDRWHKVSNALLLLCDHPLGDDLIVSLRKISKLPSMAPCPLYLPLQSTMTVSLPSTEDQRANHRPFTYDVPTLHGFVEEVEVMKSLQKPRKLGIIGSDGQTYNFLCKPKDDMRKDARLMDFNSIINKLLKTNSESRRRRLHIRTYSVVPLNEECGLIEWVPNTTGFRWILEKYYSARGISIFAREATDEYQKARERGEANATKVFIENILPRFPPVFHEWFIVTFAEPTTWLKARLSYSRTAAVISMVGFILGLGDRHGENILFDTTTGDTVHVDFNCLFDKGKTFTVPERVPFRLTNNIVDGMGVTGVEGVFRNSCEVTMQILRDNKDSLMSVLEAFVHDPLVEWEDERRKEALLNHKNRGAKRKAEVPQDTPAQQLRALAHKSLLPISRKLQGISESKNEWALKQVTTNNQVEALIKEASSPANLSMMYYGWASWL